MGTCVYLYFLQIQFVDFSAFFFYFLGRGSKAVILKYKVFVSDFVYSIRFNHFRDFCAIFVGISVYLYFLKIRFVDFSAFFFDFLDRGNKAVILKYQVFVSHFV